MVGTLEFNLLRWQRQVLSDQTRFKCIVAGRRTGKTAFALVQTVIKGLECKDKTAAVLYVAPTWGMAKVLAWQPLLELAQPVIKTANVNDGVVQLINGVKIYVRGSDNPDSLRGMKLYHVTLDEFQDAKPHTWSYIIRPALADMRGTAVFIGSPKPDATEFRAIYDLGQTGEDDEWRSWLFKTSDNELIDKKEIEAARKTLSTAAFLQEFEAEWDTAGANLLKLEWLKFGPEPKNAGDYWVTVDLAGFEEVKDNSKKKHLDFTAISVVKVMDEGTWWVQKIEYGRWDVRETAVRVLMAIRTFKPVMVGIERGALHRAFSPYLTDLMRKHNVYSHIEVVPIGSASKASRICMGIQGLLEHGRITFNDRENWDELKKEMVAFPSERAHDDVIDSLALLAHIAVTSYMKPDDSYSGEDYEVIDEICGF